MLAFTEPLSATETTYDDLYRVTRTVYDDATPTSPTASPSASTTDDFRYDDIGNLTKDATNYYYWDYENRLTKVKLVSDGSDVAEYTYDATMRRVEKVDKAADPDVTTRFLYDDNWRVLEERDGGGTLQATYINGPRIDEYVLMNRDSTDYWYMQSTLVGNVAALVDANGAVQEGYKYLAYGEATVLTGAGNDGTWFTSDDTTATTSSIDNPYTFTGRRLDSETMLMYYRFRMYDPVTGRFVSRDPSGYADGPLTYMYVLNSPTGATDAFGLVSCPGGRWRFAGWSGGAHAGLYPPLVGIGVGGSGALVHFMCAKGWLLRMHGYESELSTLYEYEYLIPVASGTIVSGGIGVGTSAGVHVVYGEVTNAPSSSQLAGWSLFGVDLKVIALVVGGGASKMMIGDSHTADFGLGYFGVGVSVQFVIASHTSIRSASLKKIKGDFRLDQLKEFQKLGWVGEEPDCVIDFPSLSVVEHGIKPFPFNWPGTDHPYHQVSIPHKRRW